MSETTQLALFYVLIGYVLIGIVIFQGVYALNDGKKPEYKIKKPVAAFFFCALGVAFYYCSNARRNGADVSWLT